MPPKISIITITLNSERYLEQTITSVVDQSYENLEYIIIDGGSTDTTLDIIKKYESKIDRWISELDEGIADAMNKGLALTTGDYILFLHSDDYLLDSKILGRVSAELNGYDVCVFQVLLDDQGHKKISKNRALDWRTNFKMGSCHQGQLCSSKLFRKIGPFDISFKIDMDYDLLLKAYRQEATSIAVDFPISVMRLTGISSRRDWPGLSRRFQEEQRVHMENCSNQVMRMVYKIYWVLYPIYRRIRYSFLP